METIEGNVEDVLLDHLDGDASTPEGLKSWIESISFKRVSENEIRVLFGSRTQARYFKKRFGKILKRSLREAVDSSLTVSLDVKAGGDAEHFSRDQDSLESISEDQDSDASSTTRNSDRTRSDNKRDPDDQVSTGYQSHWGSPVRDDFRFENFVVGNSNQLPHAACKAVMQEPGRAYNPVFIHGDEGLGKTHLLQALCHEFLGHTSSDSTVLYLSSEKFVNHYVRHLRQNKIDEFREAIRGIDLLLVDDVHFLGNKEGSQGEFFHTFNALYNSYSQIVLTSNQPPDQLPNMQSRLLSRFGMGLVVRVESPDRTTSKSIVNQKCEEKNIRIPEETTDFVSKFCSGNVRKIESSLSRLRAFQNLRGIDHIDVEKAKEILGGENGGTEVDSVPMNQIIETVSSFYEITEEELTSASQERSISRARHVALYLSRQLTDLSLSEIGNFFGGKDHSTVHYAVKKISDKRREDRKLKSTLDHLKKKLSSL